MFENKGVAGEFLRLRALLLGKRENVASRMPMQTFRLSKNKKPAKKHRFLTSFDSSLCAKPRVEGKRKVTPSLVGSPGVVHWSF
jgi:hypothetical protein